ncbi:MAG: copper resistance protein CopC, partial [Gemmatimonadaceae bacterium]
MTSGGLHLVRAVAVSALLAAVTPIPAWAHGSLKSSAPAAGARLFAAPRQLRLNFTEAPELAFTSVALFGPDRAAVLLDSLQLAPDSKRSVVATIRAALAAGTYLVVWQMGGADGHPVRGRFTFAIAPGASGLGTVAPAPRGEPTGSVTAPGQSTPPAEHHEATHSPGAPDSPSFDAESLGYVAVRWLQFMALVIVVGALAFHFAVLGLLRRKESAASPVLPVLSDRTAAGARWVSVGLVLTVLLRLYAQSYAMHGETRLWSAGLIGTMIGKTVWGWGWLLQAAAVVVSVWGFARARRQQQRGWLIAGVGVLALAFTPALSGHA